MSEDESEYVVEYWANTRGEMKVDASSEEEAIEEAQRLMEEEMYYGDVNDPVQSDCSNFEAREW